MFKIGDIIKYRPFESILYEIIEIGYHKQTNVVKIGRVDDFFDTTRVRIEDIRLVPGLNTKLAKILLRKKYDYLADGTAIDRPSFEEE